MSSESKKGVNEEVKDSVEPLGQAKAESIEDHVSIDEKEVAKVLAIGEEPEAKQADKTFEFQAPDSKIE